MSKNKSVTYEIAQKYLKDKDTSINAFIENALNKTQQIFDYANLPDSIPQEELENLLQRNGHCIIAKVDDTLYALGGTLGGELDVYQRPKYYSVANTGLNIYKEFEIGKDCILIKNDYNMQGMLPIIMKYGVLLIDSELSLNMCAISSRMAMLISASDDKTKASADVFLNRILNGDYGIIGESAFFDGIKIQSAQGNSANYIPALIQMVQYYKGSFLNEIGLNANFNLKRERLASKEVALNIDALLPLIDNMFSERVRALTKVNEMFNTDIIVDYNSIWKTNHEHADKETADTSETVSCENSMLENMSANGQQLENDKPVEADEPSETTEPVEADEPSETTEPVEADEPSETTEPVEDNEDKKKRGE